LGFSILVFSFKKFDIQSLLQPGKRNAWYIIPGLLSIPLFFLIFLPNRHLLKWDNWLAMNIFICLVNPWLEELYWRGLISKAFKQLPLLSYILSAGGFGLSHPFIFGINSSGVAGIPAFIGAFTIGSIWRVCLRKTESLRGCIITHFLIDVAGMAVFILADKAFLMLLPL